MKTFFRISLVSAVFACAFFLGSCNEGVNGFNAPTGSSVTLPDGGSSKIFVDTFVFISGHVVLDSGVPGNSIDVRLFCENCDLYDTDPPGRTDEITDTSELVFQGPIYNIKTNDRGGFDIVVLLRTPSFYGLTSYEASLTADIGVNFAETTFSVSTPE
jgi:hypothetical protein